MNVTSEKGFNLEMIIRLKHGLGKLEFGMSIDDVINMLGQANYQEDIQDDDCFTSTMLSYDSNDINLFFEGNGSSSILSDIEVENPEATLFDTYIFKLNQQQIIDLMKSHDITDNDINYDSELKETCLSFEKVNLDFYFDDNKLVVVNYGVLVSDEGNIIND